MRATPPRIRAATAARITAFLIVSAASSSAYSQTTSALGLDARPDNLSRLAVEPPATADVALERQFPNLSISNLTVLTQIPGDSSQWFFATRDGLVGRFLNDQAVAGLSTVMDIRGPVTVLPDGGLIQFIFHPKFPADPRVFVNYW